MQQPQSSSTLNNYISGCQNNHDTSNVHRQSGSSCVECQHINKIEKHSSSDSSSESSSHDDGELVQPLHRHIIEHSRQIEATITQLQQQIQKLKSANSFKDILIQQLRRELKQVQVNSKISHSLQEDAKQAEFFRRQKEIQQIRKELYENSQHLMNTKLAGSPINATHQHNDQDSINEELRKRLKKVEVMFEDKSRGKDNVDANHGKNKKTSHSKKMKIEKSSDSSDESSDEENHHVQQRRSSYQQQTHKQTYPHQKIPLNNHRPKKLAPNSQSQTHSNESSIQQELNQYHEKITRLENHIQFCEDEMLWMTNFIIAFLKMSEKVMANFNESVLREHWNLKKKTKIAWRYTKHILSYLLA